MSVSPQFAIKGQETAAELPIAMRFPWAENVSPYLKGWRSLARRRDKGGACRLDGTARAGTREHSQSPAAPVVDVVVRRAGDAAADAGHRLVRFSRIDVAGRGVHFVLPGPDGTRAGGAGAAVQRVHHLPADADSSHPEAVERPGSRDGQDGSADGRGVQARGARPAYGLVQPAVGRAAPGGRG